MFKRKGYVQYLKGHKNSEGESAPWVIKDHKTGRILSSHATESAAKKHLKQMQYFKHKADLYDREPDPEMEEQLEEIEEEGTTVEDLEIDDQIPGGLADDVPEDEFDLGQLDKGTEVEMEHTDDSDIAREITKDHLVEDSNYYDRLEEMEEGFESPEDDIIKEEDKGAYFIEDSAIAPREKLIDMYRGPGAGDDIKRDVPEGMTDVTESSLKPKAKRSEEISKKDIYDFIRRNADIPDEDLIPSLVRLFNISPAKAKRYIKKALKEEEYREYYANSSHDTYGSLEQKVAQGPTTPKPTEPPPEGSEYAWDTETDSWILMTKSAEPEVGDDQMNGLEDYDDDLLIWIKRNVKGKGFLEMIEKIKEKFGLSDTDASSALMQAEEEYSEVARELEKYSTLTKSATVKTLWDKGSPWEIVEADGKKKLVRRVDSDQKYSFGELVKVVGSLLPYDAVVHDYDGQSTYTVQSQENGKFYKVLEADMTLKKENLFQPIEGR